jgi:hypothetical protein
VLREVLLSLLIKLCIRNACSAILASQSTKQLCTNCHYLHVLLMLLCVQRMDEDETGVISIGDFKKLLGRDYKVSFSTSPDCIDTSY